MHARPSLFASGRAPMVRRWLLILVWIHLGWTRYIGVSMVSVYACVGALTALDHVFPVMIHTFLHDLREHYSNTSQ